jgi:hypothetical protein
MAVTFYGQGVCYIPKSHRFIQFTGGEYTTADEEEIAVLAQSYQPKETITPNIAKNSDVSLAEVDGEPVKPKRGRPKNVE